MSILSHRMRVVGWHTDLRFLFPAGEIAPSLPLLYFLVPLTIGFDILVYLGWYCSLGSDDLNYWFFLLHSGSGMPLGPWS